MKIFIESSVTSLKTLNLPIALTKKVDVIIVEHWKDIDNKKFGKELENQIWCAFGSFQFTRRCEEMGAVRLDNLSQFHASSYYNKLSSNEALLNHDLRFYPLDTNFETIQRDFGKVKTLFLKPNSPFKDFEAKVYNEATARFLQNGDPTKFLCAAKPKKILAECRFFKLQNTFMSAGFYKVNDSLQELLNLEDSALKSLVDVSSILPEYAVIDVGWSESTGLKIIELNSIHNSGWYGLNVAKFLEILHECAGQSS